MCKAGEIYTYILKNDIGTILKAGLGLFAVVEPLGDFAVVCPALPFSIVDTKKRCVCVTVGEESKAEELAFLTEYSIKIFSKDLKKKVAELTPKLVNVLAERYRHNIVFTSEIGKKTEEKDVVLSDETEFLRAMKSIKSETTVISRGRYLETDKHIILKSEEILMDEPYTTLVIPISIEDDNLGRISLVFEKDSEGKTNIAFRQGDNATAIYLTNFDNSLGRFTAAPIGIGRINDKELSINFWSSLNNTSRIVKYTLYLEK